MEPTQSNWKYAKLPTLISSNTINSNPHAWRMMLLKQTDLDPSDPTKMLLIYGYNDTDMTLLTTVQDQKKDLKWWSKANGIENMYILDHEN
jgi:hypothetical protein